MDGRTHSIKTNKNMLNVLCYEQNNAYNTSNTKKHNTNNTFISIYISLFAV